MRAIHRAFSLLLFWLLAANEGLRASHVLGGEIMHKHENGNRYSFQVVVYRNCAECAFNTNNCSDIPDLDIVGSPGTIRAGQRLASVTLTRTSVRDITPLCRGELSRCDTNTGFPSGIEVWTFVGTYDFSSLLLTQCEFDATIRIDSRSDAWGNAEYYYNFSRINLCNSIRNSSPAIDAVVPLFLLAQNEAFRYNLMAVDPEGDSLSYQLATALKGYDRSLSYPSGMSARKPITAYCSAPPLCNPDPTANPPAGIWFDSLNGSLVFTPVSSGERGFIVLEITEWRLVSGKMTRVGITRRDIQYYVMALGNHAPNITTSGIPEWFCAGEETCFDVYFTDKAFGTRSDSLRLGVVHDAIGADFIAGGGRPGYIDAGFCWTPADAQVRSRPYLLKIWAADNACPLNLYTWKTWNLRVARKMKVAGDVYLDTCGTLRMKATPEEEHARHVFNWFVFNNRNELISQHSGRNQTLRLQDGGRIITKLELTDGLTGCKTIFYDTLQVPVFARPMATLTYADSLCPGSTLIAEASVTGGRAPFTYRWNGAPGNQRHLAIMPDKGALNFELLINDGMGCSVKASGSSKVIEAKRLGLRDTSICSSSNALELESLLTRRPPEVVYFNLLAGVSFLSGASPSTWFNHNGNAGRSRCMAFYTDRSGCFRSDTCDIRVTALPNTGLQPLQPVCQGTPFVNLRTTSGLELPGGQWYTAAGKVSGDTLWLQDDAIGVFPITYRLVQEGCEILHEDVFRILPRPIFRVASAVPDAICVEKPLFIDLASEPAGAQWSGQDVAGNRLKLLPRRGSRVVYSQYRDPATGCVSATLSHQINVFTPAVVTGLIGWKNKVCSGDYLELEIQTDQAAIYRISASEADALSSTNAAAFRFFPSRHFAVSSLRIEVQSHELCPARDTVLQVAVVPAPAGSIHAASMSGCAPFGLQLQLTADAPDRVSWQLGDFEYIGNGKTYFQSIPTARSMMVFCKIEKDGCTKLLPLTDSIRVYESPAAAFDVLPGTVLDLDYPVAAFRNTSMSADMFKSRWFFSGPSAWESDEIHPEVSFPLEGLYDVRLMVETDKGCTSIASKQLRVAPHVRHFVPNAFTPDRKGPASNELFKPLIDYTVSNYSFLVFNRWGEKVFESSTPSEGWNGQRHSENVPAGSYAWKLRYTTVTGREINDGGVVLLIR